MQSSRPSRPKKGYASKSFGVPARSDTPAPGRPSGRPAPQPLAAVWVVVVALWRRCRRSIGSSAGHCPVTSSCSLALLVNGLAALYKLAQLQVYAMPDAVNPPCASTRTLRLAIVAKTNTAICDQDDDGSLSFLIASAWCFHFISIFFFFLCIWLFSFAIVMGIMEKIVLHLNNNTRTWQ